MCARTEGENQEVSEGKADLTMVCFLLTKENKERRMDKISGAFSRDAQGFGRLDDGKRAVFTSLRAPPLLTLVLRFSFFFRVTCGLFEKLGFLHQK